METISSCYKENGIGGLYDFIQDQIYEIYEMYDELYAEQSEEDETEINVDIPDYLTDFEAFLAENYNALSNYPQTLINALYHSSLLKYPEIIDWFEELKKESMSKPIELLWSFPKEFNSYYIRKGHDNFAKGLIYIGENRFATSSEDGKLKVWAFQPTEWKNFSLRLVREMKAHEGYPVNNLAYHTEKKWIASCGDDNTVRLWDSETFEMITEFSGHTDYVSNVIFRDNLLFSASKDKRIGVWDINTLQNITFLEGHSDWIDAMSISPDNKSLFSVASNNQLIEWDIEHFTIKHLVNEGGKNVYLDMPNETIFITLEADNCIGHRSSPHCANWASGNKLYTSLYEVIEWDCKNWDILRTFAYDKNDINCSIIKDSLLITFSKLIKIYHLETGELIKEYRNPEGRAIRKAVISDDEQFMISSDDNGYITIWDWKEMLEGEYSYGIGADMHSFEVFYKDKEDDSGVAVSGGFVSEAGIWDLKSGILTGKIEGFKDALSGAVRIAKLHNRSSQVLCMHQKIVEMQSPFNPLDRIEIELPNAIFHPDIVVGTKNGIIFGTQCYQPYYFNLNNKEVRVFDENYSYANKFSISPDQRYALAHTYPQSFDHEGMPFQNPWKPVSSPIVLIDLEKEEPIGLFWCLSLSSLIKLHEKWEKIQDKLKKFKLNLFNLRIFRLTYPRTSAWSADSKLFAAGFNNGQIIICDAETKKRVKKIKLSKENCIVYLAWQKNGLLIAMLYDEDRIVEIDPKSGKILKSVKIQGNKVVFEESHQQGRYIIWSDNKMLGIFDTLKFEIIFVITTKVIIRSVRIENNKLLIGGDDGFLYGYNIEGIL